jgi:hypothetical protein
VPDGKYKIVAQRDATIPIPPELQAICDIVLAGEYKYENQKRILYSQLHETQLDSTSPMKRGKGCKCKNGKCTDVKDKIIGGTVVVLVMGIIVK